MYAQVEKTKENKSRAVANSVGQKKNHMKQDFGFVDNRSEAVSQRKLQGMANNSPRAMQPKMVIQLAKTKDGDEIPDFLYHATSAEAAVAIMEEGLGGVSEYQSRLTGQTVRVPRKIWLIGDSDKAAGSGEGVVLEVNTAGIDALKLRNQKRIDPLYSDNDVWIYTGTIAPEHIKQL